MLAAPRISVDDIAARLRVAKGSVYRWIDKKGLPAYRMGRLWKFEVSEIDEWVRRGGANEHNAENLPVARKDTMRKPR